MFDAFLVPEKTVAVAKGDSNALDVSAAKARVFLVTLSITGIVEQEALDVLLFTSADGATWSPKPVTTFPQQFYRGETPLLLDLSNQPEARFVRAHWDVTRWGRGPETPMFEFHLSIKEVPPEILRQATAGASIPQ